jgi:NDP-sugar pyrophosphorylase family protein
VWSSPSLVVYGDNLMRFDLTRLLAAHRAARTAATVALFDARVHANTGPGGGRAVQRADGRVDRFREGGSAETPDEYINAGVYVLEPVVADWIGGGYQDFGHAVLPLLAEAGELTGYVIEADGFCLGLDTPERFSRATELVTGGAVLL